MPVFRVRACVSACTRVGGGRVRVCVKTVVGAGARRVCALGRAPKRSPVTPPPCPSCRRHVQRLGRVAAHQGQDWRGVCVGGEGGACARTYTPPPPSPPSPCTLPSPTQPPTHPTKADVGRHQEAHLRQLAQCPELVRQRQEHCTGGECVCGVRVWEWIGGLKQGPLPPAQGVSACAWWWGGGGAWAPQARHLHLHARPQMRCHPPLLSPRAGG